MDKIINSKIQFLNSPFELSLRILFIMVKNEDKTFDVAKLAYYDYVSTRLHDFDKRYESLHQENPYKCGEILAKKEIIKKAINILIKKDLIEVAYTETGIEYKANPYSKNIVNLFNTTYSQKLIKNIEYANCYLEGKSIQELDLNFRNIIRLTANEYPNEALLRGGLDEIEITD